MISYSEIIYKTLQVACFIASTTHRWTAPTASRRRTIPDCTIQMPQQTKDATRDLNEVFWMMLDDLPTWRSMSSYEIDNSEQVRCNSSIRWKSSICCAPKNIQDPDLPPPGRLLLPTTIAVTVTTASRDLRKRT